MTGALVLALPGLLCAVMAWDLSRPRIDVSTRGAGRVVDLRLLTVAGVLAAGAGVAYVEAIRAHFPALQRVHLGQPVAYFDGPGGTQVPRAVPEAMVRRKAFSSA